MINHGRGITGPGIVMFKKIQNNLTFALSLPPQIMVPFAHGRVFSINKQANISCTALW